MSLFGLPSAPRPEFKPQPKPAAPESRKIIDDKKVSQGYNNLRYLAKGFDNQKIKGVSGTIFKKESEGVMNRLIERADAYKKVYGGYGQHLQSKEIGDVKNKHSILGKMQEEVRSLKQKGDFKTAKGVEKDMKIIDQWRKGF